VVCIGSAWHLLSRDWEQHVRAYAHRWLLEELCESINDKHYRRTMFRMTLILEGPTVRVDCASVRSRGARDAMRGLRSRCVIYNTRIWRRTRVATALPCIGHVTCAIRRCLSHADSPGSQHFGCVNKSFIAVTSMIPPRRCAMAGIVGRYIYKRSKSEAHALGIWASSSLSMASGGKRTNGNDGA
jgi:hypothetical protein